MTRVVRILEANDRNELIIRYRIDTEPRNASLKPMQAELINEFIEIMKDINFLRECLGSLRRNSTA